MKPSHLFAIAASLIFLSVQPAAQAGLQVAGGVNYLTPTDDDSIDDGLIGVNLELGMFTEGNVIDSFLGINALVSGDENNNFGANSESDYLSTMILYRAMLGLSDSVPIRLYGEAGIGLSRTEVSVASLGNGKFNVDDYGIGYNLGLGVEFAVTDYFAIDLGYNFLGLTDVQVLDSNFGGDFHSVRLNVVFRF